MNVITLTGRFDGLSAEYADFSPAEREDDNGPGEKAKVDIVRIWVSNDPAQLDISHFFDVREFPRIEEQVIGFLSEPA
jgi:hypothetical protein